MALCRDSMLSPMIVMLLRLLTSAEIQRRTDFFAPMQGQHAVAHDSDAAAAANERRDSAAY